MPQVYTSHEVEINGVGKHKVLAASREDAVNKVYNIYRLRQPDKTKYTAKQSILAFQ